MAKILVELQQKKLGFTIKNLIIINKKDIETVGGCYENKTKTIVLNIGGLNLLRNKYNLKSLNRVAAAVLFEECYHAAHFGSVIDKEDLAAWYGASQAAKLPEELFANNNGIQQNNKEKKKMKLKEIPVTIVSGTMFDFVNKIINKLPDTTNIDIIKTTYGKLKIKKNDNNITTISIETDKSTLKRMGKILGNVTRASIEYAGMVYIHDKEEGWKSYIDIDNESMVEVDLNNILTVKAIKKNGELYLEATANKKSQQTL